MPLFVSDVPDAPQGLVLAERKNRTVKLKWIPGDDHNSTTTGNKVPLDLQWFVYQYTHGTHDMNLY